jgi:DNA-directed RNA polymerase specialized sigma24 family protein
MSIVQKIISHQLTIDAINKYDRRHEVLDEIEPLIVFIDDTTEEGSLIFDELEEQIDSLLEQKRRIT